MMVETQQQNTNRAKMLDGARVADAIKNEVERDVERLKNEHNVQPCLVAVRVGDDAASEVYVRNKISASESLGLKSEHHHLRTETTQEELLSLVCQLNERNDVDGILVQLPLPKHINEGLIIETINPSKDVDGFHPVSVGRLSLGQPTLAPCTPAGIIELLERNQIQISGARAVVVGRSNIVGRPMVQLLLQRDATVTICHSRTRNLPEVTREADILIAAIGRPAFIRAEHIKQGAIVVDVGMNKVTSEEEARSLFGPEAEKRIATIAKRGYTLIGDVHPAQADTIAGMRTPVPGGVGLLTVAMLMKNTVAACLRRRGIELK
jgi:methylenetetrahydrofolate dehydrogenase (NADP+)/methenyltetrahydrofolate cyclohydrolase